MQRSDIVKPPEARVAHVEASSPAGSATANSRPDGRRAILVGLAGVMAILVALFLLYILAHDGRVFRGVQVLGANVGGMGRAEAVAAISEAASGFPADAITLSNGSTTWTFSPADLSVAVDVDKTVDAAMSVGRAGGPLDNIGRQLGTLTGETNLVPVLKHDSALLDKVVGQVAGEVDRPAVDSRLEKSEDGTVHVTPSSHAQW